MAHRIGVVGLGKIATDQHLPVIEASPDFELTAVVTSRGQYGQVPTFATLAELIAGDVALDALSLCMPPQYRFELARAAVEAGFHVLLERPPTATVGELEALVACAEVNRRTIFTTWQSRYNPAVEHAKRLLAGQSVRRLRVDWKEDVGYWHPGQEWIWEPGGFGVFDPGINAFSIISEIMPLPVFVTEASLDVPANKQTPIAARIRFGTAEAEVGDLVAEFDWRQSGAPSWDVVVEMSDGVQLRLADGGTRLLLGDETVVSGSSAEEYRSMYERFALLLAARTSDIDATPLRLVADCFTLGRRRSVEAFS